MRLNATNVNYSPMEVELFSIIRETPGLTVVEIAERYYGDGGPFHRVPTIRSMLKLLAQKVHFNDEPFEIVATRGRVGSPAFCFRIEKRPEARISHPTGSRPESTLSSVVASVSLKTK